MFPCHFYGYFSPFEDPATTWFFWGFLLEMIPYQDTFRVIPYTLEVIFNQNFHRTMMVHGVFYALNFLLNIYSHFPEAIQEKIGEIHLMILQEVHHHSNMIKVHVSKPTLTSDKILKHKQ